MSLPTQPIHCACNMPCTVHNVQHTLQFIISPDVNVVKKEGNTCNKRNEMFNE